jgi:hypothetical protein
LALRPVCRDDAGDDLGQQGAASFCIGTKLGLLREALRFCACHHRVLWDHHRHPVDGCTHHLLRRGLLLRQDRGRRHTTCRHGLREYTCKCAREFKGAASTFCATASLNGRFSRSVQPLSQSARTWPNVLIVSGGLSAMPAILVKSSCPSLVSTISAQSRSVSGSDC